MSDKESKDSKEVKEELKSDRHWRSGSFVEASAEDYLVDLCKELVNATTATRVEVSGPPTSSELQHINEHFAEILRGVSVILLHHLAGIKHMPSPEFISRLQTVRALWVSPGMELFDPRTAMANRTPLELDNVKWLDENVGNEKPTIELLQTSFARITTWIQTPGYCALYGLFESLIINIMATFNISLYRICVPFADSVCKFLVASKWKSNTMVRVFCDSIKEDTFNAFLPLVHKHSIFFNAIESILLSSLCIDRQYWLRQLADNPTTWNLSVTMFLLAETMEDKMQCIQGVLLSTNFFRDVQFSAVSPFRNFLQACVMSGVAHLERRALLCLIGMTMALQVNFNLKDKPDYLIDQTGSPIFFASSTSALVTGSKRKRETEKKTPTRSSKYVAIGGGSGSGSSKEPERKKKSRSDKHVRVIEPNAALTINEGEDDCNPAKIHVFAKQIDSLDNGEIKTDGKLVQDDFRPPDSNDSTGHSCSYNDELLHDYKIVCRGKFFYCHRILLLPLSDMFKTMFTTRMEESITGVLNLSSYSIKTIRVFLLFAYGFKVESPLNNLITLVRLLEFTHAYQITSLAKISLNALQHLTRTTAFAFTEAEWWALLGLLDRTMHGHEDKQGMQEAICLYFQKHPLQWDKFERVYGQHFSKTVKEIQCCGIAFAIDRLVKNDKPAVIMQTLVL